MSKVKNQHGKGVEICVSWVDDCYGHLPKHAVEAGDYCFVIRAQHNGEYIPGKFVTGHESVYVCYDGKEIPKSHYQVLVHTRILKDEGLQWKATLGETVPAGAIIGGTDDGAPLYIVRCGFEGSICVGKYLPTHGRAYVPYGGIEHGINSFEVLCIDTQHH